MHPALTLDELAGQKADILARSEELRRDLFIHAADLKPVVGAIEGGVDVVRELAEARIAGPALFGVVIGELGYRAMPKFAARALSGARFLMNGWRMFQALKAEFAEPVPENRDVAA